MVDPEDNSHKLSRKIELIQKEVLLGNINLLDYELVPLFDELKKSITISNLVLTSKSYSNACTLLDQKFGELKKLLSSRDSKEKFVQYMALNPEESEIASLFNGCWRKSFNLTGLSMNFLELSKKKLGRKKSKKLEIKPLTRTRGQMGEFILEVSEQKFTDSMMDFYNSIIEKLPCFFEEIFNDEQDQIKIYEKFVYVLHLLQSSKIKYQKETNTLYL
ncbi:MAG: hypothetical protein JW891_13970 [Candidatus Lokiarchaeota archaeon]|nr:hypothetical protein [Candidatus Lokiarchaeota archaeon]